MNKKQKNSVSIEYRSDVDGIRAVAVLSVILYHINSKLLPGGFLGVDIFFVLSGYLITLLLAKNIEKSGSLNLKEFYRRRIQRIFPALLFMLIPTLIIGFILLAPDNYYSLSKSSIFSLLSAANFYFCYFVDTGYFALDSYELPLKHLWSLGVEEQFYILWPFVVLFIIKFIKSEKYRLVFISIALISSLSLAQILLHANQSLTYYMLPTRAWEIMAGCFVAFVVFSGIKLNIYLSEFCSILGTALVCSSLFLISDSDYIPGIGAAPAVFGTALMIIAGGSTCIARFISLKPFIAVGLVSYSAYLWHWPILAFLRYSLIEITPVIGGFVIFATFLMAALSFFFVEHPLRILKVRQRNVFVYYFTVPVIAVSLCSLIMIYGIKNKNNVLYSWKSYDLVKTGTKAAYEYEFNCQSSLFNQKNFKDDRCVSPDNQNPTVLLVGDSNAAHYLGIIRTFSTYYGFSVRNATQSSCPMIFSEKELSWVNDKYKDGCSIYRTAVEKEAPKYETVIIGGAWDIYNRVGGDEFRAGLRNTISSLSQNVKNIIILAQVPKFSGYNKDCSVRAVKLPFLNCSDRIVWPQIHYPVNKLLEEIASSYSNVYYFDISENLCHDNECSPYLDGVALYFDPGHISMTGSEIIGKNMLQERSQSLRVFDLIFNSTDDENLLSFDQN